MTETAILSVVCVALWGVVLALVAVVWSTLKERNAAAEDRIAKLEAQNTIQETAIGRLTERAITREETHAQHREDMQTQFARIDTAMGQMNSKLDALLRGSGSRSPYPDTRKT